jgi:GTP-binding protein
MERLGERRAQLKNMENDGKGRTRLEYMVPSRGLIGFQTEFRTLTGGTGLMFHVFDHYGPAVQGQIAPRPNGVMISNGQGVAPAYSLFNLQERGRMLIQANDEVYEGMLVGIHAKDNDLTVNPLKSKQLTNFRAAGKDDALTLVPAVKFSLEQALEFIEDDELVEITPKAVRLRKKLLKENDRIAASRGRKSA